MCVLVRLRSGWASALKLQTLLGWGRVGLEHHGPELG